MQTVSSFELGNAVCISYNDNHYAMKIHKEICQLFFLIKLILFCEKIQRIFEKNFRDL